MCSNLIQKKKKMKRKDFDFFLSLIPKKLCKVIVHLHRIWVCPYTAFSFFFFHFYYCLRAFIRFVFGRGTKRLCSYEINRDRAQRIQNELPYGGRCSKSVQLWYENFGALLFKYWLESDVIVPNSNSSKTRELIHIGHLGY